MKVIPVINCPDVACVQKKLAIAKTFLPDGAMVHVDVTDGSFSAHRTWADPMEWGKLRSPFALEVHLMVDHPEQYVDNWLVAGARRLIVHAETLTPQSMQEPVVRRNLESLSFVPLVFISSVLGLSLYGRPCTLNGFQQLAENVIR